MYDKLDNLLQKWVDDTRREMYLNALDVMQRIGFTSAWDEISLMIESENDLPLAMMLDDIYTILTVGLETVLSNHAITIDGDVVMKTKIVEALVLLQDWDDGLMIVTVIDDTDDPIFAFSNLLELVTEKDAVFYHPHLVSVSPGLLRQIRNYYDVPLDTEESVVFSNDDTQRLSWVTHYVDQHPNSLLKVEVVDDLRPLGTPVDILIQNHKLALSIYEPKGTDVAAMEIVGLALLSDIPLKDFQRQTKQLAEVLYTDLEFIAKLDIAMDKYIEEVIRYGQETVHA